MKKIISISSVLLLLVGASTNAQKIDSTAKIIKKDTLWRKSYITGLNFNQSSFSSNWKGGGVNSYAIAAFFTGRAYYEKGKSSWDNNIDLQYSRVNTSGLGDRKGNDRIFIDSKYGYGLNKVISIFGSLNFQSQFDKGFAYVEATDTTPAITSLQSKFLAPGYFTESIGLDYKPNTWFDVRWGFFTARQTIVTDTNLHNTAPLNYGVPIGKTVRNQIGSSIVATLNKDLTKTINLKTLFSLFTDYAQPQVMVPRLDVLFTAKVLKSLNVTLGGTLFYDETQDYKIQTSQGLSVGLVYGFSSFKK